MQWFFEEYPYSLIHGNEIIRTIKELQYLCSTKNYMKNDYTQKLKKGSHPKVIMR